jgi:hypothetical protein
MKTLLALLLLATVSLKGASTVQDLGQGLVYFRVHTLPADLPGAAPAHNATAIDVRFAAADAAQASALGAWIKFNATVKTPVFVLMNASTSRALREAIRGGTAGVIVIAPRLPPVASDVAVAVTLETDRQAFEALEHGTPVDALLHDYPDKPRVDEAYLDREHIPDSEAPETASDTPPPPPPLVDAVLQRAVQLHRGLVALKQI